MIHPKLRAPIQTILWVATVLATSLWVQGDRVTAQGPLLQARQRASSRFRFPHRPDHQTDESPRSPSTATSTGHTSDVDAEPDDDAVIYDDDEFDMTPWWSFGQVIHPSEMDDSKDSRFSEKVELLRFSPDGSLLVNFYANTNRQLDFQGFTFQTYAFFEKTGQWIPIDIPVKPGIKIASSIPRKEYPGILFAPIHDLALLNDSLVFSHVGSVGQEVNPDGSDSGLYIPAEVQLWFWGGTWGNGLVDRYWAPSDTILNKSPRSHREFFGVSVDAAGSRVAVAVASADDSYQSLLPGRVEVYYPHVDDDDPFRDPEWRLLGKAIDVPHLSLDAKIKLSEDGNILVVADNNISDEGLALCQIQSFHYSTDKKDWVQLGQPVGSTTKQDGEFACNELAISDDGRTILSGLVWIEGNGGPAKGHVRAWHYANDTWTQKGSDLEVHLASTKPFDFGTALGLSGDGTRAVVVMDKYRDHGHTTTSEIWTFEWNSSSKDWEPVESPLVTPPSPYMALCSDGHMMALGSTSRGGEIIETFQYERDFFSNQHTVGGGDIAYTNQLDYE